MTLCATRLHAECVTCCLLFKFCMASPGLPCPRLCPGRLLLARGSFRLGEGRNGDGGQSSDRTPSWKWGEKAKVMEDENIGESRLSIKYKDTFYTINAQNHSQMFGNNLNCNVLPCQERLGQKGLWRVQRAGTRWACSCRCCNQTCPFPACPDPSSSPAKHLHRDSKDDSNRAA